MLCDQYDSVSSKPDVMTPNTIFDHIRRISNIYKNIDFKRQDMITSIMQILNNSAAGSDDSPAILLEKCAVKISHPLQILWETSLRLGKIASVLKTAIV